VTRCETEGRQFDIPRSSTVRYLGIQVDDAIEIAEKIDI